eukprot:257083-Chlamydomonas_euryale.AAC.1
MEAGGVVGRPLDPLPLPTLPWRRRQGRLRVAGRLHQRRRPPRLCNHPRPLSPPRRAGRAG